MLIAPESVLRHNRCRRGARQRSSQGLHLKIATWASGRPLNRVVGRDPIGRNPALFTQKSDQMLQRGELPGCRPGHREIAHQADSDAVFVVVIPGCLAVGAVFLLVPPRPHLDAAVRRIRTVPDHEMISEFVPAVVLTMVLVEPRSSTGIRGAVVEDNIGPPRADAAATRIP